MAHKNPEVAHRWYIKKRQKNPQWRKKNAKAARAWREEKGKDPEWVIKERLRRANAKKTGIPQN